MLQLADDIGKIRQGIGEIDHHPSQQELANMAGTSREQFQNFASFAKKRINLTLDAL